MACFHVDNVKCSHPWTRLACGNRTGNASADLFSK